MKTKHYINKVQSYQSETYSKSQVYKISPIQEQLKKIPKLWIELALNSGV